MSYLTEPSFIIGIIFSVMIPILFFMFMKSGKESGHLLLDWKTSSQWEGEIVNVPAESWYQTDTKVGNDFIYDFTFNANISGVSKKYTAKGLVRPDDIHKLRKGMPLVVKYNTKGKQKIAVVAVDYNH